MLYKLKEARFKTKFHEFMKEHSSKLEESQLTPLLNAFENAYGESELMKIN